jgi:hypothetical protein
MPGQNALVRYGFSAAEGVPGVDFWYPRWATEETKMERPNEADPNIDPSGNETEGENLMASGTFKITGAPDSESYLPMRVHQHGFYDHESPTGGVELYELRDFDAVDDDPVAHYIDSLHFGVWRDVRDSLSEYRAHEAKVSDFTLTANANKYVMFEHNGLYLRDTYMADPTAMVSADFAGRWVVRGHRRQGDESGPAIAFRVSTAGAIGVAKLKMGLAYDLASLTSVGTLATATTVATHGLTTGASVTVSGATPTEYNVTAVITVTGAKTFTYVIVDADDAPATGDVIAVNVGATEYLIVDDWMDTYTAAAVTKGTRREPVQIRPVPDAGDTFTIGDTWRIPPQASKPVAVVSTRPKLNATEMELNFTIGGGPTIRKIIQSFTFKMGTPREAKEGVGSKYMQRIGQPDNSKKWWEISFDRDLTDLDYEHARISGAHVSAYAKFYGSPIGSTAFEDFAEFTFAALKVTDAGGTVTSPGDTPEKVTMRAFPASPGASLCVERYQNTVASIDPT